MTESLISNNRNVIKLCLPLAAVSFILFICGYIYDDVEKLALTASAVFAVLAAIIVYCYASEKVINSKDTEITRIKDDAEKLARIHYALHLVNPESKLRDKISFGLRIISEMLPEPVFACYLCQGTQIEFIAAARNTPSNEVELVFQDDPSVVEITNKIHSITDYDSIKKAGGFTKPLTITDVNRVVSQIMPIDFYSKVYGILVKIGESKLSEDSERRILEEFCKGMAIVIDGHEKTASKTESKFSRSSTKQPQSEIEIFTDELYEGMLVSHFPSMPSWDIAHYFKPSENRADFMDYLDTSTDKQMIILGKCSGRGLNAALYINKLKLIIRCFIEECLTPADLLNKLSKYLSGDMMPDNFVDILVMQISPIDSQVVLAMAGNTVPIINRTRNGFAEIPQLETGIPLGLFNQGTEPYKNQYFDVTPGDGIIIHTDGITDFPASNKERMTKEQLKNILDKLPEQSAKEMLSMLVNEITGNNSGEVPEEDHSIIYLKAE